jgi:hypothetical protein
MLFQLHDESAPGIRGVGFTRKIVLSLIVCQQHCHRLLTREGGVVFPRKLVFIAHCLPATLSSLLTRKDSYRRLRCSSEFPAFMIRRNVAPINRGPVPLLSDLSSTSDSFSAIR